MYNREYRHIDVRFLKPTTFRGLRVKAVCDAGSITVAYDYSLDQLDNGKSACQALNDRIMVDSLFSHGIYRFVRNGHGTKKGFTLVYAK